MAIPTFLPADAKKEPPKHRRKNEKLQKSQKVEKVIVNQKHNSSWNQIKKLLTCKQMEGSRVHDPTSKSNQVNSFVNRNGYYSKLGSSCNSRICTFRDVVHGSTSRGENSQESCDVEAALLRRKTAAVSGSSSSSSRSSSMRSKGGSGSGSGAYSGTASMNASTSCRAMQFRKMSGCYECHMIVDPSRYPLPRSSICVCSKCGEVFPKMESLELHQAVKHAVSELGPEDSGRNIVEIIFKSSWLKRDNPICKIERILKVHNTPRTIQRFEECRDAVKIRATANTIKNPRCDADGNELLRFHCTTLTCSLGARGSSTLCGSAQGTHGAAQGTCGVCTVIRHGFKGHKTCEVRGVRTTASSGRAHDCLSGSDSRRAMLVCRVIAGRVKHAAVAEAEEDGLWYDSVAGYAGVYSNLEELYVSNPRAILPCFVVIYKVGYIME